MLYRNRRSILLCLLGPFAACESGDIPPSIGDGAPPESLAFRAGGAGGDATEPSAGQELSHCEINGSATRAETAHPRGIDDFDDGDGKFASPGRAGIWYSFGDGSGQQEPETSAWAPEPGGPSGEGYALHVKGGDFKIWGSGQGTNLARADDGSTCVYDASLYDGLRFWARGVLGLTDPADPSRIPIQKDLLQLKVNATELDVVPEDIGGRCDANLGTCYDSHRARIELDECWQEFFLPFSSFVPDGFGVDGGELDLEELVSVGFEIGAHHDFDLWIDELGFYRGEPNPSDPVCSSAGGALGTGGEGGAEP